MPEIKEKVAPMGTSVVAIVSLLAIGGVSNTVSDVIKEHNIAGGDYDQVKEYLLNKHENEEAFTLEEWQTIGKIYGYEIKKNGKIKLKNIKTKEEIPPKIKEIIIK